MSLTIPRKLAVPGWTHLRKQFMPCGGSGKIRATLPDVTAAHDEKAPRLLDLPHRAAEGSILLLETSGFQRPGQPLLMARRSGLSRKIT